MMIIAGTGSFESMCMGVGLGVAMRMGMRRRCGMCREGTRRGCRSRIGRSRSTRSRILVPVGL